VTTLSEKVSLLHRSLDAAGIPHAFGGAIALAFCTADPRATADIDVNVFLSPEAAPDVFAALPDGVAHRENDVAVARDRGQRRLDWETTPVDLFFAYHAFHTQAQSRSRAVGFLGEPLPVLDCADLVVFKAISNRPRDWVDIDAVIASGGAELEVALDRLEGLLGKDSAEYGRLEMTGSPQADGFAVYRRAFGTPRDRRDV
jgi:hypothetical protein